MNICTEYGKVEIISLGNGYLFYHYDDVNRGLDACDVSDTDWINEYEDYEEGCRDSIELNNQILDVFILKKVMREGISGKNLEIYTENVKKLKEIIYA